MKAGDPMVNATAQTVLAQTPAGSIAVERPTRDSPRAEAGIRSDRLELSEAALENIQSGSGGVRTELVERLRGEIAAGTYLTDEKLDAVVDRLHRELFR